MSHRVINEQEGGSSALCCGQRSQSIQRSTFGALHDHYTLVQSVSLLSLSFYSLLKTRCVNCCQIVKWLWYVNIFFKKKKKLTS